MIFFYRLRVYIKNILKQVMCVDSFCKQCGRDVHDFIAPDCVWNQVSPRKDGDGVLCYDCFCEKAMNKGLPCVWELSNPL